MRRRTASDDVDIEQHPGITKTESGNETAYNGGAITCLQRSRNYITMPLSPELCSVNQ